MAQEILAFSCALTGVTLAATAVSARVALEQNRGEYLMFVNDTNKPIHVLSGDVGVVATTKSMPIVPGEKGIYSLAGAQGKHTHLAFRTVAGVASMLMFQGQGT